MLRKVFALLVVGLFCISELSFVTMPAQAATLNKLTVNGTEISAGRLYGVDDTTLLQFAILAYVEGQTQYKSKNQNFPGPGGTITPNYDASVMFDQYFGICAYYELNLMRIGAGDKWGSQVMYEAWLNHHDAFIFLLTIMAEKAEKHGVYVCVVLAGCAEYPAYTYGGSGDVFSTSSSAYNNYITYARDVMTSLDNENGIGLWDMMNEPDYDTVYNSYWSSHGGKTAFSSWERSVASDTASSRTKTQCWTENVRLGRSRYCPQLGNPRAANIELDSVHIVFCPSPMAWPGRSSFGAIRRYGRSSYGESTYRYGFKPQLA